MKRVSPVVCRELRNDPSTEVLNHCIVISARVSHRPVMPVSIHCFPAVVDSMYSRNLSGVSARDGEGAVATQMTAAIIKPFKLPPPWLFYAFSAVSSFLSLFCLLNKAF